MSVHLRPGLSQGWDPGQPCCQGPSRAEGFLCFCPLSWPPPPSHPAPPPCPGAVAPGVLTPPRAAGSGLPAPAGVGVGSPTAGRGQRCSVPQPPHQGPLPSPLPSPPLSISLSALLVPSSPVVWEGNLSLPAEPPSLSIRCLPAASSFPSGEAWAEGGSRSIQA